MAEQAQPAAPRGGGNNRGRGGHGNGPSRAGAPATVFLNPERAPPLIAKWQKLLGKDLDRIEVVYEENGVSVHLYGKEGTAFLTKDKDGDPVPISVAEYRTRKEKALEPSSEDAIFAFKNKFEVRLNLPFPDGVDLGDGSETALRNAVQALPFAQRRVMLMSGKQFNTAYPNGFGVAQPPAA